LNWHCHASRSREEVGNSEELLLLRGGSAFGLCALEQQVPAPQNKSFMSKEIGLRREG